MPGELLRLPRNGHVVRNGASARLKIACVFGTRPELIKFYPVMRELRQRSSVECIPILTSQHTDLISPLVDLWDLDIRHDLGALVPGQSLNDLLARLLSRLDKVFEAEQPDFVLVQGDTASALAGAMAAWNRRIPVGHIEAGLRSGNRDSPFPEEMFRRQITAISTLHFAPTARNVATLRVEAVPAEAIFQTGNPVVDAVQLIHGGTNPSFKVRDLLTRLGGKRVILLTTHRRESFGDVMQERLRTLRRFVETCPDVHLVFPVHANPDVRRCAAEVLADADRVHLIDPLAYPDFLHCLSASWLLVSDSGGVQEEAPSLGKPVLVIRPNTERPEALEAGVARLVGEDTNALWRELLAAEAPDSWVEKVRPVSNPFGNGDSALRITNAILGWFDAQQVTTAGASEGEHLS